MLYGINVGLVTAIAVSLTLYLLRRRTRILWTQSDDRHRG